jgi:hypothetical protein
MGPVGPGWVRRGHVGQRWVMRGWVGSEVSDGDGSSGDGSGGDGSGGTESVGNGSVEDGSVRDVSVGDGSVAKKVAADPSSFNWFNVVSLIVEFTPLTIRLILDSTRNVRRSGGRRRLRLQNRLREKTRGALRRR